MIEEWKPIDEFNGVYEISNLGNVRRLVKRGYKPVAHSLDGAGYPKVNPSYLNKSYNRTVHRLVAAAFIPNPLNKPFLNHKDGDKTNYSVNNLEWCTRKENCQHAYNTGLNVPFMPVSTLNKEVAEQIRAEHMATNLYGKDLASKYGVTPSTINKVIRGELWK